MGRWLEIDDGIYPDGFPRSLYQHEGCETSGRINAVYPFCPFCGKKMTRIKTIFKGFDCIYKNAGFVCENE